MDRRGWTILGALLVGLLALVALFWLFSTDTGPAATPAPAVVRDAPTREVAPPPDLLDELEEPDPDEAEALVALAAAAEHGLIRCPLSQELGPMRVVGVVRHWREGSTVVAEVATEAGQAQVLPADGGMPDLQGLHPDEAAARVDAWKARQAHLDEPAERWVWEGARPGEFGVCRVEAPVRITLSGRVVGAIDGVAALQVRGCGGKAVADEDGRFTMETWAGPPCSLHTGAAALEPTPVAGDRSQTGLLVDYAPHGVLDALDLKLEELEAERAALQQAARAARSTDPGLLDARVASELAALDGKIATVKAHMAFFEQSAALTPGDPGVAEALVEDGAEEPDAEPVDADPGALPE